MSLPVLSSLSQLLSGTVNEEFRRLLNPWSLVSAAIFMFLHLTLLFPLLREANFSPIIALESLPTVWQIALGTLCLFAFSYLVNSLAGVFLAVANGRMWENYPLVGQFLKSIQERRYNQLKRQLRNVTNSRDQAKAARAAYRLAYEFPDKKEILPTRLGNVLTSAAHYTSNQYGAHLDTLWPMMNLTVKRNDETLHAQLNDNYSALSFLVTVTLLLIIFAFELVLVALVVGQPAQLLWCFLIALVAYLCYYAAGEKAEAWGRDIRTAFDLYLDDLGATLHLQTPYSREVWEKVSNWLAYGASTFLEGHPEWEAPSREATLYAWHEPPAKPESPKTQLLYPSILNVEEKHLVHTANNDVILENELWLDETRIDYFFSASFSASDENNWMATGNYLHVADERITTDAIPLDPVLLRNGQKTPIEPVQVGQEGKPAFLWHLGPIANYETVILQYAIDSCGLKVAVTNGVVLTVEKWFNNRSGVMFVVKNAENGPADLMIEILEMNYKQFLSEIRFKWRTTRGNRDAGTLGPAGVFVIPRVMPEEEVTITLNKLRNNA